MKRPRLRDVWRFTRPAWHDTLEPSGYNYAERWVVAVWEDPTGGYKPCFRVQAALRGVIVPEQWHRDATVESEPWPGWRLVPAHVERVPCRVPSEPHTFTTLAAARERARGLALVLSGRMAWTDVRFSAYGADSGRKVAVTPTRNP